MYDREDSFDDDVCGVSEVEKCEEGHGDSKYLIVLIELCQFL